MAKVKYRKHIGEKIVVSNLKQSKDGKYMTGVAAEHDNKPVYVLSENTENLMLIAVIVDENGWEKWVAADQSTSIIEPNIRNIIGDDTDSEYYCLYEKTCGSIVYMEKEGVRYYLLIENHTGHVGFPKGHVEFGETEEETAQREVFEETHLNVTINPETRQAYTYKNPEGIVKNCVYFCSEFSEMLIKLQKNEIIRCWLVPYKEACELLNYPQDKLIFAKADKMR